MTKKVTISNLIAQSKTAMGGGKQIVTRIG
jgi:hypothetical protein